jgi:hypothetical protein
MILTHLTTYHVSVGNVLAQNQGESKMPMVGGKKYSYTPKGRAAAAKAKKRQNMKPRATGGRRGR